MADTLFPLKYGTVTGRYLVQFGDSDDDNLDPDIYPAQGTLVFTPAATFANVKSAQPVPATVFPQPVYAVLDSEGYVCSVEVDNFGVPKKTADGAYIPVERGVRMQASSDPNISPTDWTWRVSFSFRYGKINLPYPDFNFTLEPFETVDLTFVKPISEMSGTITLTGPRGLQGEPGPKGETGPVNELSIGTVKSGAAPEVGIRGDAPYQILDFTLQRGPVGPSGGPIPAGGEAGQIIRVREDGGFEWFTPSNLVSDPIELEETNLDTIQRDFSGIQSQDVFATETNGYPIQQPGYLRVYGSGNEDMAWQVYDTYGTSGGLTARQFRRSVYQNEWSAWVESIDNTMIASDTKPGLMSPAVVDKLNKATNSAIPITLMQRDAYGDAMVRYMISSSATQSTNGQSLAIKSYVDSQVKSVNAYTLSGISTADVNTLVNSGVYFIDPASDNAPSLVGLSFGGILEVHYTSGGGYSRVLQKLTVNSAKVKTNGVLNNWGSNGSDFFGFTFSRVVINGTPTTDWTAEGETPSRATGVTPLTSSVKTVRYVFQRRVRNNNLRVWGTFDTQTSFRSGDLFNLTADMAVKDKQIVAATEAAGGWGKVAIASGTVGRGYFNAAGVAWITFDGEWDLA